MADQPIPVFDEATEQLTVNSIRFLALDAIDQAKSGHPGMVLGAAPMAYVLFSRFLKFNPRAPLWPNRDRFILSSGHASALLYSLLHHAGYTVSLEDMKNFRQWGSLTPGHPEYGHTPGVEATTGPLGQGLAMAVGMAIAERALAAHFNRDDYEIVNHYTYVLAGDGDLMEGVVSEASSLAGHLRLGKLICLYDSNDVTLAGPTNTNFTEDTARKFEALEWHVQKVADGNDLQAITEAIAAARKDARPSLIIVKTHIGFGSSKFQDSFKAHGAPFGPEETLAIKKNLGWNFKEPFTVPEEALNLFVQAARNGVTSNAEWDSLLRSYSSEYAGMKEEWDRFHENVLPENWEELLPSFPPGGKAISTRAAGGQTLDSVSRILERIIGGSADLAPSTKTELKQQGWFAHPDTAPKNAAPDEPWSYAGRNIAFGVREHAMGAILNGIAAHGSGLRPFGSTFLVFADYLRPALRLAALMKLPVVHVFTHDSIAVGEDGPTHQPIEQIASLRAIPGLTVIRPADANETVEAWRYILTHQEPTALILSRQNLPVLEQRPKAGDVSRGAYILADSDKTPSLILIATGSEVALALKAWQQLTAEGIAARLVNMPSWELFEAQPQSYRESVLPPTVRKRLAVEAGSPQGWERYVGLDGAILGMTGFGASGPGETVMKNFGFTVENIVKKAKAL